MILRERSPLATAIVTSVMLRTWSVRLLAIEFTLLVRSFQTPLTSFTRAWPPSLPSVPTSRATRVTSEVKTVDLLDHRVDDRGGAQELAFERPAGDLELHLLREVALRDRSDCPRHFRRRPEKVVDQHVEAALHLRPGAAASADGHAVADLSFVADDLAAALELVAQQLVRAHDLIECIRDFSCDAELIAGRRTVKSPSRMA